jgi:methyl-accepting chemotaxis protein
MTDFANTNPSTQQQWNQLSVIATQLVQSSSQQSQKLEILIDQIGRLTELITVGFHDVDDKFRNLDDRLDRLTANTEHLLEVTTQQNQRLDRLSDNTTQVLNVATQVLEVATQQNLAIQRLTEAQEVTVREQAAIVAAQTENVSRLIQLLDRR